LEPYKNEKYFPNKTGIFLKFGHLQKWNVFSNIVHVSVDGHVTSHVKQYKFKSFIFMFVNDLHI
jgi:hypothetical protein